jgi:hypothetical protein
MPARANRQIARAFVDNDHGIEGIEVTLAGFLVFVILAIHGSDPRLDQKDSQGNQFTIDQEGNVVVPFLWKDAVINPKKHMQFTQATRKVHRTPPDQDLFARLQVCNHQFDN